MMERHISFVKVMGLFIIVLFCFVQGLFGADEEQSPAISEVNAPLPPYVAQIIGDDTYIRSGAGMDYYHCGKIAKSSQITVVGRSPGWFKIVPPRGSFSWVSKQYIQLDANNPDTGLVMNDNVLIWAGSEYVEPMHSESLQTRMHPGDRVKLLGEEKSGYYKIEPPSGAYLWVSEENASYLGTVGNVLPAGEETPTTEAVVQPIEPQPSAVTARLSPVEASLLNEYYAIVKKIEAERAKPFTEQQYAEFKAPLQQIAENPEGGKAARYAKAVLERLDRFEFALRTGAETELQDQELARIRDRIKQERQTRLNSIVDLGSFTAAGWFRKSQIYDGRTGVKRYLILDDSGKVICYAQPESDSFTSEALAKFSDRKVGLTGRSMPDTQTATSLVIFSDIKELESSGAAPETAE
ncbi:MAG: SH3 domain-containing protein [Planctomycetota bacterium]